MVTELVRTDYSSGMEGSRKLLRCVASGPATTADTPQLHTEQAVELRVLCEYYSNSTVTMETSSFNTAACFPTQNQPKARHVIKAYNIYISMIIIWVNLCRSSILPV
jgi:hypothetical protein